MRAIRLLAIVVTVATLGGCTSSNVVNAFPCTLPSGTQVALFYPAPGSTGIPDAIGSVIVAASPALPNNWAITLVNVNGSTVTSDGLAIVDPPFPTPNAPPPFANAGHQGGVLPTLASGATYHVFLKATNSACSAFWPGTSPGFTTQ